MGVEARKGGSPGWCRVLAGLEAGLWGGVAMLAWFGLGAALSRRSIWIVANSVGALLAQRSAVRSGFSGVTLAGLASVVFTASLVGVLFALLARHPGRRRQIRLLAILTGLVWYYLSQALVWRQVGPVGAYSSPPAMLAAYLIFGVVLGWYPSRLRSLERHLLGSGEDAPSPNPLTASAKMEGSDLRQAGQKD
jgi:hypothetical protein